MKNGKIFIPGGFEIYLNDELHCEDGPAKSTSDKFVGGNEIITEYYLNGLKHREDGPALLHKKGKKILVAEFWVNGKFISKVDLSQEVKKFNLHSKLENSLNTKKPKEKKNKI